MPLSVSFEGAVMLWAVGIALYFILPVEPPLWPLCFITLALWLTVRVLGDVPSSYVTPFALIVTGLWLAAAQTQIQSPNPLTYEQRLSVNAIVMNVDEGAPMRRLYLSIQDVDPVPRSGVPDSLRIRVGRNFPEVAIGQAVALDVVAGPVSGPAVPGGYDPARRAFFDGLAGSGFAIGDPQAIEIEPGLGEGLSMSLTRFRKRLAGHIVNVAPERTAGLQAALLTGIRDHIPEEQTEALRASGLAHILAISGLHMGMVAFGVFWVATLALACIEPLARSRDVRKPAAIIGIVAAILYLLLSGASVATQRAFIMVVITFLAVLLDRRAISFRSVAVAAVIVLLLRPEALMSVGFQMSFAAVTALVVCYRVWQEKRPAKRDQGWGEKAVSFYTQLGATSFIAMIATGGFALFHFGRIANYGLLGNLAAMAIFPVVMATGLVSLIMVPLGWEGLPLVIMGWMIGFMVSVAEWVSNLPGAVGHVKATSPYILGLYSLGFATVCFASRKALIFGGACIALSLGLWGVTPTDDLRVNPDGRVSILTGNTGWTSSLRADRFGRERFAQGFGEPDLEWDAYQDDYAQCDALACRFHLKGRTVSVVEEASEVTESCKDSDIVILANRSAGPVARRHCKAMLIDEEALRETGGMHLTLGRNIEVKPINPEQRRSRPWGRGRD